MNDALAITRSEKTLFLKGRILLSDDHASDDVSVLRLAHCKTLAAALLAEVETLGGPDREDLLLLLADEATQRHRSEPGPLSRPLSPAARVLLERYIRDHDWQSGQNGENGKSGESGQNGQTTAVRICLGTAVRALVQLTVDVSNLPGVVEGDRAAHCRAYLEGLLRAMEVGSSTAAEA